MGWLKDFAEKYSLVYVEDITKPYHRSKTMAFEQNPDCGSLFRNNKKSKPTDRDHNGDAKITCPHCGKTGDHWISGWVNDLKNSAGKYFGLRFSAKDDQGSGETPPAPGPDDFDDDIPF